VELSEGPVFEMRSADMRGEYDKSQGQQAVRHLKAIVAWHAAAVGLLDRRFRDVTQHYLGVGLAKVTSNEPKLMTDEEVMILQMISQSIG
jgi:hypothetical protein